MAEHPGPVLVTGANSGFGLAGTLRFASRGWEVWGTVRSQEKARTLIEAARAAKVEDQVKPLVLNVSDHQAVVDTWPDLPDFYGVVNNAGYAELGAVEEVTAAQARGQLDINLIAPAVISACALPGMRRLGKGRIVMVSSAAGRATLLPLNAWYHASKFGLEALSDILRVEVARFNVRVSIVEPGFFKTGLETAAQRKIDARQSHRDSLYAGAYERTETLLALIDRYAPPADKIARAIVSAVESKQPKRRYLIGVDALAAVTTQAVLPRGMLDAVMGFIADLTTPSVPDISPSEPDQPPKNSR